MLSQYFAIKTKTESFKKNLESLFEELKDKKVLLYGAGEGFVELNKHWVFKEKLNIVGISDIKFTNTSGKKFEGFTAISPADIPKQDFEVLLITNEAYQRIIDSTSSFLNDKQVIRTVFVEDIEDEVLNINHLEYFNFSKYIHKLKKKLKNKTVVIYGAGLFFQLIKTYYDLSGLNIIGICDKRFEKDKAAECLGFKTYVPSELKELQPDYVIVATKVYINIVEDLYYNFLKGTKTKIKPIYKKHLINLLQDIWAH